MSNLPSSARAVNDSERPAEPSNTGADPDSLRDEIAALRREVAGLKQAVADPDAPEFLTVEQVAKHLSLSERTVRSYLASDDLPSVTFGRARRIPVNGLNDFVESRMDGGGCDA